MSRELLWALLRRPKLWPIAATQMFRMARRGWWRRPPFLPVSDSAYLGFRAETQYGDPDRPPEAADVVAWLEWCAFTGKAPHRR